MTENDNYEYLEVRERKKIKNILHDDLGKTLTIQKHNCQSKVLNNLINDQKQIFRI